MDNLLLGLVDSLCAVCRFVPNTYFERAYNQGICSRRDNRAVDHVFRLVFLRGGTAIDLTSNGDAGDQITGVGQASQLFAMINFMFSPTLATLMFMLIVVLLMAYLVTSADFAVLTIKIIAAAGDESPKGQVHIVTWGVILTLLIAGLLLTKGDGLEAINTAMIIGALPFSFVMALMACTIPPG